MRGLGTALAGALVQLPAEPLCARDEGSWCARIYFLTRSDILARYGDAVLGTGLRILLILVLAMVIRFVAHRAIKRFVRMTTEGQPPKSLLGSILDSGPGSEVLAQRRSQRAHTIGAVLRSATSLAIYGVTGTLVLGALGIELGPIIASAGILGLALGFGAQNLVKDFLSGMFIMVEDQYGVGDVVDLGDASGTVEAVGLRVTTLRDPQGNVWYVRNGEVSRVSNASQGYSLAVVDLPIGHDADIQASIELAGRIAAELTASGSALAPDVLEPPEVLGVESISSDCVTLRITTKVQPGRHLAAQRAMRAGIKQAFVDAGIPAPSSAILATFPLSPAIVNGAPPSPVTALPS
ncbi:MAG: mechanosensitive ion channel family protein [Pseudonocardiaceae bacterium]